MFADICFLAGVEKSKAANRLKSALPKFRANRSHVADVRRRRATSAGRAERIQFLANFPNFFESAQTHPKASRCIRMHPNAFEQVRAGPSKSENSKKLATIREILETFAKFSHQFFENSREGLFLVIFVDLVVKTLIAPEVT